MEALLRNHKSARPEDTGGPLTLLRAAHIMSRYEDQRVIVREHKTHTLTDQHHNHKSSSKDTATKQEIMFSSGSQLRRGRRRRQAAGGSRHAAHSAAESASPDSTSQLFDHKPASQPSNDDKAHPGDERQTMFMTVFFLVLMVIYVGFCAYYRKGKSRRTVHDEDREARRRANQVVMDESQSAAARARESAEELTKMEQRKAAIKRVLMIREIIDDEVEVDARETKNSSGYWFWETKEVKSPKAIAADEGALPASSKSDAGRTAKNITIKGEEDEEVDEMLAMAGSPEKIDSQEVDDRMSHIRDIESNSNFTVATEISEEASEAAGTTKILDVDNPTSQSGPTSPSSGSSLKRYTDALNCGACSSHPTSPSSLPGPSLHKASIKNLGVPEDPTITLGEIQSDHAECQICLSQFQVGDRAAWKRHPSSEDEAEVAEKSSENLCTHVFHEECISRWLMVRDGCPFCRRSYFLEQEPRCVYVGVCFGPTVDGTFPDFSFFIAKAQRREGKGVQVCET